MRDIVATIQREQDDAIRSPASGVTLVRGGPGTGKTAVALHRAAFLLYSDRQRFAGGGVLVVGPSPVFVTYISRVLPSLGEDEVALASLGTLVPGLEAHPPRRRPTSPPSRARRGWHACCRGPPRDNPPGAPTELRLLYRGQLLRLGRRRAEPAAGHRDGARLAAQRGAPQGLRPRSGRALAAGRASCSARASRRRAKTSPKRSPSAANSSRSCAAGGRSCGRSTSCGWLADAGSPARGTPTACSIAARSDLLAAARCRRRDGADVSVEDVALLDELGELLGSRREPPRQVDPYTVGGVREVTTVSRTGRRGAPRRWSGPTDYREYAHIVVDEAQDVSPMQWRMIGRRAALRELDHRRRPGAVGLAGRRRPRPARRGTRRCAGASATTTC